MLTVVYQKKAILMKVHDIRPNMGCDPEFFFKSKGEVVGAETVLPEKGLVHRKAEEGGLASKFIIDGVQAELNPHPSTCRASLASEIRGCFRTLDMELKKRKDGMIADFSRTVEISKANLDLLKEESKKFGCAPSKSIYAKMAGVKLESVDPTDYRIRAAGGHIHIGKAGYGGLERALTTDHIRTVEMLDLLCGNTAVLVDRDEGNIERRKLYGKAGEFRLPKHGLEYRTLSNFWLTSYPLMSLAFGMARLAVQLMADDKYHELFYKEFMSKVKPENVATAINDNNFELAVENFHAIEDLIGDVSNETGTYPIHGRNMKEFKHFVNTIQEKGLTHWFKTDPMKHWVAADPTHMGFNDFLRVVVAPTMAKAA